MGLETALGENCQGLAMLVSLDGQAWLPPVCGAEAGIGQARG